jgi:small subunit ribosomal protein S1
MVEEKQPKSEAPQRGARTAKRGGERRRTEAKAPVRSPSRPAKPEVAGEKLPTAGVATEEAKTKPGRAVRAETRKPARTLPEFPPISMPDLDREYSDEEQRQLEELYAGTMKTLEEGQIVKGRVLEILDKDVVVDIGFKSEGILPLAEFPDPDNVKVGDEVEVFLEAIEDQDGQLVLSKRKADFLRVWDRVKEAYEKGQTIDGKIVKRIKGGMVVDLYGVEAFLPGSQISLKQVPNFDDLIGQSMALRIVKLNKPRRNIVVSRRIILEEEREVQRSKILGEIAVGQVREGVVKNIIDFGAFIDLGGVDGLLHITDMSWGRINHPADVVNVGDKLLVKVVDVDKNTGRVSLGLKQLTPYPWENIEEKYPVGKKVKGKIVSLTDYGAFVELEKGVEGLIHISEMSWTGHVKHPSKILTVGQSVETVVLFVDKPGEKISLGIKQLEPDPWVLYIQKNPIGSKVTGKVRNLTNFGAFLELQEGVDGLIHISDMSWTKRLNHPAELFHKGESVEAMILNIDVENRRISLGHKQINDDPWPELAKKYALGNEAQGKITKLLEKGVVVDLGEDVEAFVPLHHLARPEIQKPEQAFQEGETLPLKVVEFDRHAHRIVLSVEAYYKDKERSEFESYLSSHPVRTQKVDELVTRPDIPVPPMPAEEAGGTDSEAEEINPSGETSGS